MEYPLVPPSAFFSLPDCSVYTFYKKLKNVSCKYNRLNGWNFILQAAWYIRRVRIICFLWTKPTTWLLILLSFTLNIVRACSMFYPYEGYRSVTPLDAARINRTIFHNHSVHWYYITLIRVGIILILDGLKRNMSRGNSLSDELDLSSVLGDTRDYLYSLVPFWGR